jgi:hypothetical protein
MSAEFSLRILCLIARYPYGLFYGLIWPKDVCASIVWPQRRRATFFPWAFHPTRQVARGPRCAHSSRDKKLARLASFATLRPAVPTPSRERDGDPGAGASPIASGLLIAIEAAMVAGSKTANKENYHG